MWWKKAGIAIGLISLIYLIGYKVKIDQNILGVLSPLADEQKTRVVFNEQNKTKYPPNDNFPLQLLPKFNDTANINAKSLCVMDVDSRELLMGKNISTTMPIASVAKIMTAMVALERSSLNFEIKIPDSACQVGEAEMGLTPGEKLTTQDLLYGMMLPSGNDAAESLAQGLGRGGREEFINAMNEKAKELNLYDTHFVNPTGLDGNSIKETSYSTCLDLLSLTNYALKNPKFAEIVDTRYREISYVEGKHKAFYLLNKLHLDKSYPGIKGVKPGDTPFAGETLVSYAENGGKKLIVFLLDTLYSKDEVIKLYDDIYGKLGIKVR